VFYYNEIEKRKRNEYDAFCLLPLRKEVEEEEEEGEEGKG